MTDYGDALIPPYDKIVIASQVLRDLGGDATYQQVWDLLLEYGLDPFEPSWDDVMDAVISLRPPERSRSAPS